MLSTSDATRYLGAARHVVRGAALSLFGIGIAAGSLAGLLLSESTGLFGFRETGFRGAIVLSIALEAATIVLLTIHLAALARPGQTRIVEPMVTVRSTGSPK